MGESEKECRETREMDLELEGKERRAREGKMRRWG